MTTVISNSSSETIKLSEKHSSSETLKWSEAEGEAVRETGEDEWRQRTNNNLQYPGPGYWDQGPAKRTLYRSQSEDWQDQGWPQSDLQRHLGSHEWCERLHPEPRTETLTGPYTEPHIGPHTGRYTEVADTVSTLSLVSYD